MGVMLEGRAAERNLHEVKRSVACSTSVGQWLCVVYLLITTASIPVATQAQDVSTVGQGDGVFGQVPVCQPLMNIIGDSMNNTEKWGRFTEPITSAIIQQCVTSSFLHIPDGLVLRNAIRETIPAPEVKVLQSVPEPPLELPHSRWQVSDLYRPGSVNVLDCQGNWIDMTHLPVPETLVDAVVVYWRCHLTQSKNLQGGATQVWVIDSFSHGPCEVTIPGSPEGVPVPTEENPRYVEESHPQVGPAHIHTYNWTQWCYTQEDYERIFVTSEADGKKLNKSRTGVIIGAIALSVLAVLGAVIFMLTPRCVKFFYNTERDTQRNSVQAQAPTPDWMVHNREFALWWPTAQDHEGPAHSGDVPQRRMRAVAMSDGGNTTAGWLMMPSTTQVAMSELSGSVPVVSPNAGVKTGGSGRTNIPASAYDAWSGMHVAATGSAAVEHGLVHGSPEEAKTESFMSASSQIEAPVPVARK